MKDLKMKDYNCIHRFLGECPSCKKDYKNLECLRYYPLTESLGGGIVPPRNIKDDLVKILEEETIRRNKREDLTI